MCAVVGGKKVSSGLGKGLSGDTPNGPIGAWQGVRAGGPFFFESRLGRTKVPKVVLLWGQGYHPESTMDCGRGKSPFGMTFGGKKSEAHDCCRKLCMRPSETHGFALFGLVHTLAVWFQQRFPFLDLSAWVLFGFGNRQKSSMGHRARSMSSILTIRAKLR